MKRILTAGVLITMATSIAWADIGVWWRQSNSGVLDNDSNVLTNGYAQLIWSPSDPSTHTATDASAHYLATGERLLCETDVVDSPGLQFDLGAAETYADTDVGGTDINSGYFFSRIFDEPQASLAEGSWYIQAGQKDPTLTEYDTQNPNTVYDENVFPTAGTYKVDTQMVPEPSTFLLLGFIVTFIYRTRKIIMKFH